MALTSNHIIRFVSKVNVYTVTFVIIRKKDIQSTIFKDVKKYQWEIEKRPLSADNGSVKELILDNDLKHGRDFKRCFVSVQFTRSELKKKEKICLFVFFFFFFF